MDDSKVFMFPESAKNNGIDPGLYALIQNNGGFGNGNWIWLMFLWAMWGFGGNSFGGNGMNGGAGFLANQLNNNQGRDLVLQALDGRADALGQLASITNTGVETVKNGIFALQNSINQLGLSTLDVKNAVLSGNAAISQQLCQCCCENRLAIANQTAAIQAQLAANDANVRLQLAQLDGSDKLAVCQQTNQLGSQADRNANEILKAISAQTVAMNEQFCALKERELQNKIDTQGDIITQLRGQISNDKQTETFTAAINALNEKINTIAAKQPNTVPVQYPNIIAANATPYVGYGYQQSNFWN